MSALYAIRAGEILATDLLSDEGKRPLMKLQSAILCHGMGYVMDKPAPKEPLPNAPTVEIERFNEYIDDSASIADLIRETLDSESRDKLKELRAFELV